MFIRDLLKALADAQVPYCIVGGVAVNLHGIPRMTYDLVHLERLNGSHG